VEQRLRRLARLQGAYYFVTGLWPLVAPRSFQAVTGPKADMWLAQTVGALVAVVGAEVAREQGDGTHRLLAAGSALALGGVETLYALRGRIRRAPYLADAGLEAALVAAWLVPWSPRRSRVTSTTPTTSL
jgi:hypothetical protein